MNTDNRRLSLRTSPFRLRAELSPLFNRGVIRTRHAASTLGTTSRVPSADSLTPETPAIVPRLWIPGVIDRLQMPLSRIRE